MAAITTARTRFFFVGVRPILISNNVPLLIDTSNSTKGAMISGNETLVGWVVHRISASNSVDVIKIVLNKRLFGMAI